MEKIIAEVRKPRFFMATLIVFVFMLSWVTFSINQPPNWHGQSEDKKWKTTYEIEMAPKDKWKGTLHWQGNGDAVVTKVELTKNGNVIHGWEEDTPIPSKRSYDYLSMGAPFQNSKDVYILTLHWKDKDGVHQEKIALYPKTRYFVLVSTLF